MAPREIRMNAFGYTNRYADEYVDQQYPRQSSPGPNELRALERDRPQTSTSGRRSRQVNSIDTAIRISPAHSRSQETMRQSPVDDYRSGSRSQSRRVYNHSDGTIHKARSFHNHSHDFDSQQQIDPSDMDDGSGRTAVPTDITRNNVQIPARTRYEAPIAFTTVNS